MVAAGLQGSARAFDHGEQGESTGTADSADENIVFSVTYEDYSSGSMPFGKIAPVPGASYTGGTLVVDSLAGARVGRPWN